MLKKIFVNKIPKFIFIFTVLMITLIFLYSYIQENSRPTLSEKETTENLNRDNDPNAATSIDAPEDVFLEYKKILNFNKEAYWENWDWQTKMVHFEVNDVYPEEDYMNGFIKLPNEGQISNEPRTAHIRCSTDKTLAVAYDKPAEGDIDSNFDIYLKAEVGDIIYTFCEDSACLNMGKACVLVDFNYDK